MHLGPYVLRPIGTSVASIQGTHVSYADCHLTVSCITVNLVYLSRAPSASVTITWAKFGYFFLSSLLFQPLESYNQLALCSQQNKHIPSTFMTAASKILMTGYNLITLQGISFQFYYFQNDGDAYKVK